MSTKESKLISFLSYDIQSRYSNKNSTDWGLVRGQGVSLGDAWADKLRTKGWRFRQRRVLQLEGYGDCAKVVGAITWLRRIL